MIRLMTGLAVAAAGAAVLANAGRRTRHSQRAAEKADMSRWENEGGSPRGQPQRTPVNPDAVEVFVAASAGS